MGKWNWDWRPNLCDNCGECLEACPYIDMSLDTAKEEIKAIREGKITDTVKGCITCGLCNEFCEKGANPFDLIIDRIEAAGLEWTTTNINNFGDFTWSHETSKIVRGEGKPWMNLCVCKPACPKGLFESKLFDKMNLVGGVGYYCWLGWIHAGTDSGPTRYLKVTIDNLDALLAKEIIFFHDECYATLCTKAIDLGLAYRFRPRHILEYLIKYVKEHKDDVNKLGLKIAYQRPDSQRFGPDRDSWVDELFDLIGVERVQRQYDRKNSLCCSVPIVDTQPARAAEIRKRNIEDARTNGAKQIVFLCPYCYDTLKKDAADAGLVPLMIMDLVRIAIGEKPSIEAQSYLETIKE